MGSIKHYLHVTSNDREGDELDDTKSGYENETKNATGDSHGSFPHFVPYQKDKNKIEAMYAVSQTTMVAAPSSSAFPVWIILWLVVICPRCLIH